MPRLCHAGSVGVGACQGILLKRSWGDGVVGGSGEFGIGRNVRRGM